ncbi:MAG: hypothetical protein WAK93_07070 [Solirubrobacteraceae bacterium]
MTETAPADIPLTIDHVERGRARGGNVQLRLTGRWLSSGHAGEHEALLVVQLDGRRHRFPPSANPADASPPPGAWAANFSIPSWAEPTRSGQAALWVGNAVIPVPPPGTVRAAVAPVPPGPEPEGSSSPPVPPPAPSREPSAPNSEAGTPEAQAAFPPLTPSDSGRGGPLADLLFKETVSALHIELEQRTADAARLRGALADAQSELEARAALQAGLESAHAELRAEVQQLMGAVSGQRAELDEQLARTEAETASLREEVAAASAAERRLAQEVVSLREQLASVSVSRDAAMSEAAGLRAELERLGTELAVTREQAGSGSGDLGEAERLLADARALTEQLRGGAWQ